MTSTPEGNDTSKRARTTSFVKWLSIALLSLCLLAVAFYLFFIKAQSPSAAQPRSAKQGQNPVTPAVPVVAAAAKSVEFNIYLSALGSVTALYTVTVRSRIDGQLMEVLYQEGQIVSAGDLLAKIDPRPFEVQLTQAEGQLAHDRALLKNAQVDLQRYQVLWAQDSIPKQQLDTQEALVRELEGSIRVDQGQIDSAKLQLVYCNISTPLSGRVGLRLVDPGNIIHVADVNGLVVITQLQPITIIFPIPEDNLPQVLAKLEAGENLLVEAYDRPMTRKLATGTLLTVDNQIDPTTGTVRLKAIFPNMKIELFPNQFVNARLLVDVIRGATVVPAPAIQRGPQGTFVYVVKTDLTASMRPITVGEIEEVRRHRLRQST
jgi:multidrug efflux system membrane fusion protein